MPMSLLSKACHPLRLGGLKPFQKEAKGEKLSPILTSFAGLSVSTLNVGLEVGVVHEGLVTQLTLGIRKSE